MSADDKVRVIAFPGAPNLPTFAAIEHGDFAAEGLEIELSLTPNSVFQAERTAAGDFDIIFTAFDNVVAYSEGQGAAGPGVDPQYAVIMGATQLELGFVVAPEIGSYADLKGRSLALDAPTTGFAFVLYEMLDRGGVDLSEISIAAVGAAPQRWQSVKAGEHVGTISIEPFTSIASRNGFKVLELSTQMFEAYQGGVIATRRPFSAENPGLIRRFIRAYLKGLDWVLDPANREDAERLLLSRMPEIQPQAAKAVMTSLLSPESGLTPQGRILPEGMKTVLQLRSKFGRPPRQLNDVEKYLDLSHYQAVVDGN